MYRSLSIIANRVSPLLAGLGIAATLISCDDPLPPTPIGLMQLSLDEDNTSALRCNTPLPRQSIPTGSEAFSFLDTPAQRNEFPMAEGGVDGFRVECNLSLALAGDGSFDAISLVLTSPNGTSRFQLDGSGSNGSGSGSARWIHPTTVGELWTDTCELEISPASNDSEVLVQFDCTGMARGGISEACRAQGAIFVQSCSN